MNTRQLISVTLAVAGSALFADVSASKDSRSPADGSRNPNTDWMVGGKGVFMHFLPDSVEGVKAFDTAGVVRQLVEMKADWFCIALGQNSGIYNAPNATYDRVCGYAPGTHCATRDVPRELIAALKPHGIRLMFYLPCQPANGDAHAEDAFGFPAGPVKRDRKINAKAATAWGGVIEEWSRRYGADVSGWWFDGGYPGLDFTEQIAVIYAGAVKRGNPNAVVAFNEGVFKRKPIRRWTLAGDYLAGESNNPLREKCVGRWCGDRQWHVLSFCGRWWGNPVCRYPDAKWISWLKRVLSAGGAVTIDLAYDPKTGKFCTAPVEQMKRVFSAVGERRPARKSGDMPQ